MSLAKGMEDKKYDKRILEWNLRNDVITKEEYNQLLENLSDESANATELSVFKDDVDGTELQ